jgi:ribosomal protein L37E
MTEQMLNIFKYPVLCPKCDNQSYEIIMKLITDESTTCSFCGFKITITGTETLTGLDELTDSIRNLL